MRSISSKEISKAVEEMAVLANYNLPIDVLNALQSAVTNESGIAKDILTDIISNAGIAQQDKIPLCQDTGMANFFVKVGKDVLIKDGSIEETLNFAIRKSYQKNYLRKSIVSDPLERKNTQDNTPVNVYKEIVEGKNLEITFLPKGGGSENASALTMFSPSQGWAGIKEFVIDTVKQKGKSACPPLIIGLGIGGDFSSVGLLAKKALIRKIGAQNNNDDYNKKELELLSDINKLSIGPMGLGGKTTALAVFIETKPSHIASLPVAINFQCHSCRRMTIVL
jgi:fumarate hydratase subunit alpha